MKKNEREIGHAEDDVELKVKFEEVHRDDGRELIKAHFTYSGDGRKYVSEITLTEEEMLLLSCALPDYLGLEGDAE